MCASSKAAALLLGELVELGVRDFVVCPGSRSQALALVAAEAEKLGLARLHVRIDERSAAFFALGIARETGVPAPVIVTSGTAVANLLPAVLEAHSARVPMLLLTADRPQSMRGIRSNQTISEPVALKAFTRYFADIEAAGIDQELVSVAFKSATGASTSRVQGVSQLNIAFVEPLSGASGVLQEYLSNKIKSNRSEQGSLKHSAVTPTPTPTQLADDRSLEKVYVHSSDDDFSRAIVIAGADSGAAAENFAHLANLPLLAEPSSGARFGREAIQHWVRLLKDEELQTKIQRVIVFGHPTLTRVVPQLIQNKNTVVIDSVITDEPTMKSATGQVIETYNPAHAVDFFATSADVSNQYDRELLKPWLGEWVVRDRALRAELTTVHQPDLEAARATGYKERSSYARSEVARLRKPVTREHLTE
ncbi:MAG TPA: 2-succinyl-5-enolpyruvyl-6-hydroxy-3-cyclohexene-1-carboxylic-acid synthase, partial [Microbacteriaceae bacterium]|nr:2-succinyl-5-enolpyruvyl-6-hydroxy-3-cyclohexene-1-carboxylic-acid synthase [Microbacteriaceae bacterium]